jgi:hypothetical protein
MNECEFLSNLRCKAGRFKAAISQRSQVISPLKTDDFFPIPVN